MFLSLGMRLQECGTPAMSLSQNDLQKKHTWVGLIPSVDGSLFIASIHVELKAKVAQPLRFLAYGEAR